MRDQSFRSRDPTPLAAMYLPRPETEDPHTASIAGGGSHSRRFLPGHCAKRNHRTLSLAIHRKRAPKFPVFAIVRDWRVSEP